MHLAVEPFATLNLIEHLVAEPEVRHVIFVGAYRDNEVGPTHPLARTLDRLKATGANIQNVVLQPLALGDVSRMVSDALRSEPEKVEPLAGLIFEKTGGNPFFAIQFVLELEQEGLLTLEPSTANWHWNTRRQSDHDLLAMTYSDGTSVGPGVAQSPRIISSAASELSQRA